MGIDSMAFFSIYWKIGRYENLKIDFQLAYHHPLKKRPRLRSAKLILPLDSNATFSILQYSNLTIQK